MQEAAQPTLYVDASGHVLGRLASIVAKKLLEGYRVHVFNVEKAVLSGEKRRVIESYKILFRIKTHLNPDKYGVRRPRSPTNIFKRAVKRMLPVDRPRGREAFKRLKAYIGVPPEYSKVDLTRFPEAMCTRLRGEYVTVEELALAMGWKGARR